MTAVADRAPYSGPDWTPEEREAWRATLKQRRRRFGKVVLVLLLLAALVAGAAAVWSWLTWQAPIQAPGEGAWYGVIGDEPVGDWQSDGPYQVHYRADGTVSLGLMLANEERVRITGIEYQDVPLLQLDRVTYSNDGDDLSAEPFRPFTLGRMGAWVTAEFSFHGCRDIGPGTSYRLDTITVTYEARQRTRHLEIPLNKAMEVHAPERADCP